MATIACYSGREPLRIVSGIGRVRVSLRHSTAKPCFSYNIFFDDESTALLAGRVVRPRTLLSLVVYRQDAASMPVDCLLSLWNAPRRYVIRRHVVVAGLAEELVTDGIVYVDDARSLAFCSLDATGFASESLPLSRLDDGRVLLARTYRYAHLLRTVVAARELASMDALTRRTVRRRTQLSTAPLEGSDALCFVDAAPLDDAVDFIERRLVPHTQRTIDPRQPRLSATPLAHASWADACDDDADDGVLATATVHFRLYLAV